MIYSNKYCLLLFLSLRKHTKLLKVKLTSFTNNTNFSKNAIKTPILLSLPLLNWSTSSSTIESVSQPITPIDELEKNKHLMRSKFELFVLKVQKQVVHELQQIENIEFGDTTDESEKKSDKFIIDRWIRADGGGGISCVLQDSLVFEKAGVNISVVSGDLPPEAAQQMRSRGKSLEGNNLKFFASGVSSVIHPRNPNVPTLHFNFRYFEVIDDNNRVKWWFGGGIDMTPYMLSVDDFYQFHQTIKRECDKHDTSYYPKFKKWCDDYFVIPHRNNERRGIGGIFFDDMDYPHQKEAFSFVESCADAIIPSYIPIIKRNFRKAYDYNDRQWQLLRRGRYVEFNLMYDRGTKFGLMTPGARYESILMSLPLVARWEYCHTPEPGSPQDRLIKILQNPQGWTKY